MQVRKVDESAPGGVPSFTSLDHAIDELLSIEKKIGALMAYRARVVDAARQVTESTARSTSRRVTGWAPQVVARRELVTSIACALHLPERTAENLIETSRALCSKLLATRAALESGAISFRHAETIVEHSSSIPDEKLSRFAEEVLDIAPTLTNRQLDRRAGRIRERLHPESILHRHMAARDRRCVDLINGRDGMASLTAFLPAATATAAYNRITELALEVEGDGIGSTLSQLRADVFADLLVDGVTFELPSTRATLHTTGASAGITNTSLTRVAVSPTGIAFSTATAAATDQNRPGHSVRSIARSIGRGVRATVHITVPVLTLLGASEEPAELEGYGPIDPATARELAATAPSFTRILTHPETGAIMSVGRGSYAVPKDLRRWLVIRDETCRFPGCSRSARRSEVDHTIDWALGGVTDHRNLAHLCTAHHHLRHHTAWSYRQDDRGNLEWTSPTGHRYATRPAVQFRGDTVDPTWSENHGDETAELRRIAETMTGSAFTERWIPCPDDPPDTHEGNLQFFVVCAGEN